MKVAPGFGSSESSAICLEQTVSGAQKSNEVGRFRFMEIVDEWVTAIVLRLEKYGTRLGGNAPQSCL